MSEGGPMQISRATAARKQGISRRCQARLLISLAVLLIVGQQGASAELQKFEGVKSFESSHNLFSEDIKDIAWDVDELENLSNLHLKDISSGQEFLQSSNVASYLGLSMVHSLHMGVPLSMVFVGFAGDGNQALNITDSLLATWFERLDHVLPHTRVSLSKLTCSEDGHCAGMANLRQRPSPLHSYVHLNLSCHVVSVHSKAVLEQFESAIRLFSRPVDPDMETGPQQVDAIKMEEFVDNFVLSLGLATQYTIVVLNPRWSASLPQYGYRSGFSSQELAAIHERRHVDKLLGIPRHFHDKEPVLQPSWGSSWVSSGHLFQTRDKFKVNDMYWSSEYWTRMAAEYLKREEEYRRSLLKAVGDVKASAALSHGVRTLLHPDTRPLARILTDSLLQHLDAGDTSRFRTMHPLEDCLVHLWVSQSRWLLIDLTAGGFDWGPALGGEGVVHRHSTPSVNDAFAAVKEIKAEKAASTPESSVDKELRERLKTQKDTTMAATANKHYHAYMMQREQTRRWQGAPGSSPGMPGAPGSGGTAPGAAGGEAGDGPADQVSWLRKHEELLVQAELDVLENFAHQHCSGRSGVAAVCKEAQERVLELQHQVQTRAASTGTSYSTKREHNWDIFGHSVSELYEGEEVRSQKARSRDLFLAQLSGVLSRGIRHVITPPTATWSHRGYMHDTATPWARQVHFTVYLITDSSRRLERPPRHGRFDVDSLKAEVNGLKLPNQGFHWVVKEVNLLDEPSLAVAFAASLRTSVLELPTKAAGYLDLAENEITWLDSKDLALRLRSRFQDISTAGGNAAPRDLHGRLDIPLFVFSLDRPQAIYLDMHYSTRPLEDMVLIVHNANPELEQPSGIMCNGALVGRPLSSLKGALAAVLQHLGGLLPPHLGYSPLRKEVTHDWLWSVGANPLAMTCTGLKYASLQRDALWRSYLLDAIDSSIDLVNQGVFMLKKETPEPHTVDHIRSAHDKLRQLQTLYRGMVSRWRSMVVSAYGLDFHSATDMIPQLEANANQFLQLSKEVHAVLHPVRCTPPPGWVRAVLARPVLLVSMGVVAAAVVLFATFRSWAPRRRKFTKFN